MWYTWMRLLLGFANSHVARGTAFGCEWLGVAVAYVVRHARGVQFTQSGSLTRAIAINRLAVRFQSWHIPSPVLDHTQTSRSTLTNILNVFGICRLSFRVFCTSHSASICDRRKGAITVEFPRQGGSPYLLRGKPTACRDWHANLATSLARYNVNSDLMRSCASVPKISVVPPNDIWSKACDQGSNYIYI